MDIITKVKVKATGKIIEVVPICPNMTLAFYRGNDGIAYTPDMLEPAEPDWQALHGQAAVAALQYIRYECEPTAFYADITAQRAANVADALIEELKRRYSYENSIPSPQERVVQHD